MSENTQYLVSARRFRPKIFDEVVGQDHISRTLRNAINESRIHHAYLFTGPRGVGKTTSARIFSKDVIKKGLIEAGNDIEIEKLENLDIIEIDGASNNSVDDIRNLRENSKYPPSIGKYKIYIIDEVHMLTKAAFNALLKTLEEPPAHLIFVFATTEPHKVPATIISRCQRFDFLRMSIPNIISQLKMIADKDGIKIEESALLTIAKKADGSMRDSQSIFDQAVAFCGKDIKYKDLANALNLIDEEFYFQITDNMISGNIAGMFEISKSIFERGYDLRETLNGLIEHFRNILVIKSSSNIVLEASENAMNRYHDTVNKFHNYDLIRILNLLVETDKNIRTSTQPTIIFEMCLVALANIDSTEELSKIIAYIESDSDALKKKALN
jgi:DNA polymerase-3 subunit gamma/tau